MLPLFPASPRSERRTQIYVRGNRLVFHDNKKFRHRPQSAADVERNPCAFWMDAAASQFWASGRPNGHGRYCHGIVHKISEVRSKRPGLAGLTVSYCQTVMVRCCSIRCSIWTGYDDIDIDQVRNFRQLGSRTGGSSRIRPRPRHRDHDGAARPRHCQCRRHGLRGADDGSAVRRRYR